MHWSSEQPQGSIWSVIVHGQGESIVSRMMSMRAHIERGSTCIKGSKTAWKSSAAENTLFGMRLRMVGVLAVLGSWVFACRGVLGGDSDTLYVATLLPMTGPWPGGRAMLTAATMALDHINNRTDILPHYKLHIVHGDTKVVVRSCLSCVQ